MESGSKSISSEATDSRASSGLLVPCTNRASKRKIKVKAVVVENKEEEIEKMVATLMKEDANGDRETIIGFDAEYAITYGNILPPSGQKTRISHLIFTNGKRAYVVFLGADPMLSESIMSFLLRPEFTFVSIGMKQRNNSLDKLYEACIRNAVDLGNLASKVKDDPRIRNCGIDLLAKGIGLSETPRPLSVVCKTGFSRPYRWVKEDKMVEAVANTCAYQQIGKMLIEIN